VRGSGDATQITRFNVDGAYLSVTSALNTGRSWMSSQAIDNRNDPTDANPGRINYIDVWGIPGDAPALVNTQLDWTAITGTPQIIYMGRDIDGSIVSADRKHLIESDEYSTSFANNATWSTGTGSSDNHFHRLTQDGSGSEGSGRIVDDLTDTEALNLWSKPSRVFGRVRTSDSDSTFKVTIGGTVVFFESDALSPSPNVNQWELIDFGLVNPVGSIATSHPDGGAPDVLSQFDVTIPASSSATADIDFLLFIPVDEFITIDTQVDITTSRDVHIRGQYKDVVMQTQGVSENSKLGSLWFLEPGNKANRFVFAMCDEVDQEHTLTDAARVTLTIIPRSRHLLGTT